MYRDLLERIATVLAKASIPYMIIGGQAVLVYGEPRLTKDIDITLGFGTDQLDKVRAVVDGLGLRILVSDPQEFVLRTMVLPVIDDHTGIRVDLIFSISEFEAQAIKRVRVVRIGKTDVMFCSLEDLIIHKVVAGRPRDLEDVKVLLLKNPDRDSNYIVEWLKAFGALMERDFIGTFRKVENETSRPPPNGR